MTVFVRACRVDTRPEPLPALDDSARFPSGSEIIADLEASEADEAAGKVVDGTELVAELRRRAEALRAEIARRQM